MKNISIIMGRGIEGCGVTKFTLEQLAYHKSVGDSVKVFASKDKSWTRKNAHNVEEIECFKFADKELASNMIRECNEKDFVIINSLPPLSAPDAAKETFQRLLDEVKVPIALIQHDHAMASIRRNACLDEAIKRADVIFAHSPSNGFANYAGELVGPKVSLFGTEEGTPIVSFQPGMAFEPVRNKYWVKDLNRVDTEHHKWIGRTTSWKGYIEMFKFVENYLKPNGQLTTYEGIERSPAYLGFRELAEFEECLADDIASYNFTESYGGNAHVFGPYIQEEMLHRMALSGFGYQLSRLKPEYIFRSIEYTHCEVVCTGTIPVFNKRYGERCTHRATGKKLIEHEESGTIWLDENNLENAWNQMREVGLCHMTRNKMRNDAYEFYRQHQDASHTFKELTNKILKHI